MFSSKNDSNTFSQSPILTCFYKLMTRKILDNFLQNNIMREYLLCSLEHFSAAIAAKWFMMIFLGVLRFSTKIKYLRSFFL